MNQIQIRLYIIHLAISIEDFQTVQLQVQKIETIENNDKLKEITTLLKTKEYTQAKQLIIHYINNTPNKDDEALDIVDFTEEEQKIIDEFQLFTPTKKKTDSDTQNIDENKNIKKETAHIKTENALDYKTLLGLDDDIQSKIINEDNEDENNKNNASNTKKTDDKRKFISFKRKNKLQKNPLLFANIPEISQKFLNTKKQYPTIQKNYRKFDTVETLLKKIAREEYTEKEIKEIIKYTEKLIKNAEYSEASQLLLLCASTKSDFAQLMLARELYKGSILVKNIQESFSIMSTLAMKDYPEALCDLGQFYENGIGTNRDLLKAEGLYKRSFDSGIKRAKKHYNKLKKKNKESHKSN